MPENQVENKKIMIDERVDILENRIHDLSDSLLAILLKDRSSKKNIVWGTDNYLKYGKNMDTIALLKLNR